MKATNVIIIGGGAVALLLLWKNQKNKTISTIKPIVPKGNSSITTNGNTAGTGIPTEVAIQQGGVSTTPKTEAITVSESEENRLRELALSLALEGYRRNINNQQSTPIYDDPYKGQIGGFPQYPAPPQPIDDIIEPIRFPMPSIIDPISIEVTNPSVFTKEPNYVMPVIQNPYQQEFSNVDRELFNMNQDIYSI